LAEYVEVVDLEAVVQEGGPEAAETPFISYLIIVGMYRVEFNMVRQEVRG
jgi:hypothetical protein